MSEEAGKKALDWVRDNKLLVGAVLIVLFFVYLIFGSFLGATRSMSALQSKSGGLAYESAYDASVARGVQGIVSQPTDYQIRTGSASIKSADPDAEYQSAKSWVEGTNGWVETVSKNEDFSQVTITASFRVPSESFDAFTDWVLKNHDVRNSNFQLYRKSTERQTDEIEILTAALKVYDRMITRAESGPVTDENIEIIMKITQKKLEVMRLLKQYGYDVQQTERESAFSGVTLTFTKDKQIKLVPEDIGKTFRTKLRSTIDTITRALMDIVTVPPAILAEVLKWIVYAITALIPLFIGYKILLRILKLLNVKL